MKCMTLHRSFAHTGAAIKINIDVRFGIVFAVEIGSRLRQLHAIAVDTTSTTFAVVLTFPSFNFRCPNFLLFLACGVNN